MPFTGKVLKIDASLYHGVPVTFCEGDPVNAEPTTRRHDRCFITGPKQTANRVFLRVIAGVRHPAGHSRVLDRDDFESCLSACQEVTRYFLCARCLVSCCEPFQAVRYAGRSREKGRSWGSS